MAGNCGDVSEAGFDYNLWACTAMADHIEAVGERMDTRCHQPEDSSCRAATNSAAGGQQPQ